MKVLLISGEFPPMVGGLGDYTDCLASGLQAAGVQVSVFTSAHATGLSGEKTFAVNPAILRWRLGSWRAVRREVAAGAPDVVHIQYQSAAYELHPAINLLPRVLRLSGSRAALAVTFHDLRVPYVFPKAGPLRNWMVAELARSCDLAICTNEEDLSTTSRWGLGSRARMIPIGSNIPVVDSSRRRVSESGSDPYSGPAIVVGYFGLLNQSKGLEVLLRAYRVLHRRGLQMRLLIAGAGLGDSDPTNQAYARRIKGLVAELDLGDSVHWTGPLSASKTSASLREMDICILPYLDGASFRRGTLMAALAHGLPIITTCPSYQPKATARLSDGENCRLVAPGDVGALAEAIEELACSASRRESLSQGALELSRHFSWEGIVRETIVAYEQTIERIKR